MIGYVTIGTADIAKAKAFYSTLLGELGATLLMDTGSFAAFGTAPDQPMLSVCIPFDQQAPNPGNGNMTAIPAGSTATADKLHAAALALGATDEGAPGPRGEGFYGAYFRDLDGNKLCFFHVG